MGAEQELRRRKEVAALESERDRLKAEVDRWKHMHAVASDKEAVVLLQVGDLKAKITALAYQVIDGVTGDQKKAVGEIIALCDKDLSNGPCPMMDTASLQNPCLLPKGHEGKHRFRYLED